ncbi:MAG: MBL fold metallo-hydrolase [Xanthomonadales bacterium]|nr:Ribonuclease [Xanthomonadales bacterium]MCC6592663.1 MBL fold metallo-hydrolase [Xanthomonadales bacterium]MCE7930787.1 MBL fold metallo-hydrolase [Xanthomonadales bacterium PRO6]
MPSIQFLGAAGEVTGSCHLLRAAGKKILLDCGMIQGGREEDARNREHFPFDPADLDAVILSHAHIDHCGRLPLLVKRGFAGRIHTQTATADLVRVMLEDAARLAEQDVEHANRLRDRRGLKHLEPLYGLADVQAAIGRLQAHEYDSRFELFPGVHLRLLDAGHILGAAIVEVWVDEGAGERKLVFSGDIGPDGTPIMRDATPVHEADLVLMESTYGDRLHRPRPQTIVEIGEVLEAARSSGGNVIIPAFAVGRTQELLYWFRKYYDEWQVKRWRIYLDSPMASKVVDVYRRHTHLFDREGKAQWSNGDDPFTLPGLRFVDSVEESRELNKHPRGCIFIAGSGMCNGGRIRHHLKHNLWRPGAHVMIVGYQAQNTLGRQLVDGHSSVRIFHETIRVNAHIHTVGGLSAHADQQGLLAWYGHFDQRPPAYLVHGEDSAREALARELRARYGCEATLARPGMERAI